MRDIGTQEIETDRLLLRRFTLNEDRKSVV